MKKKLILIVSLAASLVTASLLQGCVVAAVGAGIGAAKYGSAKQKDAYAKYRTDMEKLNFEREKAGLQPTAIMTYEEWAKGKK
ncbi:MAG: hypothetical protein EXS31_09600 [Pedosphaera sp.]|nr:hypothetical protein [Pedosphaera sp.]